MTTNPVHFNLATDLFMENGHLFTSEHMRVAEEIEHRYMNVRLTYIPQEDQETEEEKQYPYALWDVVNDVLIKRLKPEEMNYHHILQWLYDNDGTREDQFAKYEKMVAEEAATRKAIQEESAAEHADLAASIAKSPLHTYRFNGNKIGADNSVPTLFKDAE